MFHDIDGSLRYFWYDGITPYSAAISSLVRYDMWGAVGNNDTVIYHYTTLEALVSIIRSRSLWMTDYAYLNDASEILHGLTLARRALDELVPTQDHSRAFLEPIFAAAIEKVPRIAVSCFSLVSDSLSQWRAYSRGQCGVAIGFRVVTLMEKFLRSGVNFSKVVYRDAEKTNLFRRLIHFHRLAWEKDVKRDDQRYLAFAANTLTSTLYEFASLCKDEGFADEREYRLAYLEHTTNTDREPVGKRFRIAGSLLVPYVETSEFVGYDETAEFRPYSVVVGPHPQNELVRRGIEEFLRASGLNDVPVDVSPLPFR